VGILAAALWWVWRRIPGLTRQWADVLTLAILWLYVEICGGTPSARRVALMLTIYMLARWLRRAGNPLPAVLLAGVGTVIIDPLALNSSGFQLSYGVVLGLILYMPPLLEAMRARLLPWRDIPAESLAPWQKCVVWFENHLLGLAAVSWTALLCSAPLTAEYFGVFSAHGLALNLAMFPLTCLVLWSAATAVATGIFGFRPFTWCAWLANGIGLLGVGVMQHLARLAPPVPGIYAQLQLTPAWAGSAAALGVLAAMLLGLPRHGAPRRWYFALPVLIVAVFALCTVRPL
jgi:competence protein ComEC